MILMKQLALIKFLSAATIVCAADVPITQDELVRRTQELYDSLVSGNQASKAEINMFGYAANGKVDALIDSDENNEDVVCERRPVRRTMIARRSRRVLFIPLHLLLLCRFY